MTNEEKQVVIDAINAATTVEALKKAVKNIVEYPGDDVTEGMEIDEIKAYLLNEVGSIEVEGADDDDDDDDNDPDKEENNNDEGDDDDIHAPFKGKTARQIAEICLKKNSGRDCKKFTRTVVKCSRPKDKDQWKNYVLTLDKPIRGMVYREDEDEWVPGLTKTVWVSDFTIAACIKADVPEARPFINDYLEDSLEGLVVNAEIDILNEKVTEGEMYFNPFSEISEEDEVPNTSFYNSVYGIKIGETGKMDVAMTAAKKKGLSLSLSDIMSTLFR